MTSCALKVRLGEAYQLKLSSRNVSIIKQWWRYLSTALFVYDASVDNINNYNKFSLMWSFNVKNLNAGLKYTKTKWQ